MGGLSATIDSKTVASRIASPKETDAYSVPIYERGLSVWKLNAGRVHLGRCACAQ